MVSFCPICGSSLNKKYNYCPSCGADLKEVNSVINQEDTKYDTSLSSGRIIICDNCGGENPPENSVCEQCGIKLSGNETTREANYKASKEKVIREQQIKKVNTVKKTQRINSDSKELDMKKVWGILGGIALVGLILLYAAGIFDKPSNSHNFNQTQTQSSGIDLSHLEMINELEAKYKANPDDVATLLQLAHLKQDSGLYEQAIINYREYLTKNPDNADARIDLGVCYYNLGNYDEAIKEMTKALEYSPKHQIGHLNLGIVNLAANNIAKSKEWFQKAVDINPESDIGKRAQELLRTH